LEKKKIKFWPKNFEFSKLKTKTIIKAIVSSAPLFFIELY
jgi:hypothetical protein